MLILGFNIYVYWKMDKKIKHIFLRKIAELALRMSANGHKEVSRNGIYQPIKPSRKSKQKEGDIS